MRKLLFVLGGMFLSFGLAGQPFTRIDLTELEPPPSPDTVYFITTEGDTATYTLDVATIDSTGDRVFTIIIGSDTIRFQDQTGSGSGDGNGIISELPSGNVSVNGSGNDLSITNTGSMTLRGSTMNLGQLGTEFVYPSLSYHRHRNAFYQIDDFRTLTFQPSDPSQTYPFLAMGENSRTININNLLIDTTSTFLPGATDDTPPGNGYVGYSSSGGTLAVGDGGAWEELARRDDIDSTRIIQDSIAVYYRGGAEVGRDTIRGQGGSGGGADDTEALNGLEMSGDTVIMGGDLDRTTVIGFNNNTIEFNADNAGGTDDQAITDEIIFRLVDGRGTVYGFYLSDGAQPGAWMMDRITTSDYRNLIRWNETDMVTVGAAFYDSLTLSFKQLFLEDSNILNTDTMPAGTVDYLLGFDEATGRVAPTSQLTGSGGSGSGGAFATNSNITSNSPGDYASNNLVFGADGINDTGNSDYDERLVFYKNLGGAVAAGSWNSTQADSVNTGSSSSNFGYRNTTSGFASGAISSQNSESSGSTSTSVSCSDCAAEGDNSLAHGQDARPYLLNQHSQGGGGDASAGHHQYSRLVAWNDFSGTGTATMYLNGSSTVLAIPNNTMWAGYVECAAVVEVVGTGTSVGDHKFYEGRFVAKNISGTTTVQFINVTDALLDSGGFDGSSSVLNLTADTVNDALRVQLTNIPGSGSSQTSCTCTVEFTESGYDK